MQQPVFIEIYENVFAQETSEPSGKIQAKNLISHPQEQSNAIKHVVSFIKDAKQPVAWFGSDIARFGARADTIKWAQKVGINFFTSATSKAVIDEKNPLFSGVYAGRSSSKSVIDVIRQADAIIVFGETQTENEAFGQTFHEMFAGQQNGSKRIMYVNWNSVVEPNRFQAGPVYIRDFMNTMSTTEFGKVNTIKNVNPFVNTEKDSQTTQQGLTYDGIVHQIGQSGLMNNAITVVDGTIGVISTLTMQHNTQDSYISSVGTDSWGCAIATAVGAHSAGGKRPIVFVGDGGFISGSQSIQTVTKNRSNAVIVVFNNQLLGINQWTSNPRVYSGNTPVDAFNVVNKINISKIGEAYDAFVFKVDTPTGLADAIKKSETSDKVCIIDCQVPQKNVPMNCGWRIQSSQ
jgi:thiamine pyrophosphate-dependent acetolactate synthase large subunit-like protein